MPEEIKHKPLSYEKNVSSICDREASTNAEIVRLNQDLK